MCNRVPKLTEHSRLTRPPAPVPDSPGFCSRDASFRSQVLKQTNAPRALREGRRAAPGAVDSGSWTSGSTGSSGQRSIPPRELAPVLRNPTRPFRPYASRPPARLSAGLRVDTGSSGATDVPTFTNATLWAPLRGPAAAGRPETRTLPGCPKARWPPASILTAEVKPGPACARPSPGCPHLAWLLGPCPTVALKPPPAGPRRAGFRRRYSGRSLSPPRPPRSAPLPRPTPAPAAAAAAGARMRRRETAGGAAQMDPTWRRRA